jgi:hypothetical protein
MRRVAVSLLIAMLVSACAGAAPMSPGSTGDLPSSAATGSAPTGGAPTGDGTERPLTPEELVGVAAAHAQPVAFTNAAEERLIRLLADGSGLTAALGADAEAALAALLAAERRSTGVELERLGGVPDWTKLVEGSEGAASPGGVVLAAARVPSSGPDSVPADDDPQTGFLTAVLAASADLVDPGKPQEDVKGHVASELSIETTRSYGGFSLEIDEVAHFDLERCPDTIGNARGTIDLSISVVGTSSTGSVFGAIGELQVSMRATANDHADLVEIFGRTDGDLGVEGGGENAAIASASTLITTTPVTGGRIDRGSARRSGAYSGPSDLGSVLLSFGNLLATKHAFAAQTYWSGGSCITLGVDPPNPRVEGSNRTIEVTVSAESVRDEVAEEGTLTVTPSRGTFSPRKGDMPLKIRVTVPEGATSATAKLEFRSVRGVGKRDLAVNASAPLEWHGTFLQEGPLEIPGVASVTGHADLEFTLRASKDLSELFSPDPDGSRELVPLTLVSAGFEWYAQGSALGAERTMTGSTSRIVDLDYSDPFWLSTLPTGAFIAGEGLVDPVDRKLYVFLVASGDYIGAGTFNIPPDTTCKVERYTGETDVYQTFLVFDLDEQFRVSVGSCTSTYRATGTGGGFTAIWTTHWVISTVRPK